VRRVHAYQWMGWADPTMSKKYWMELSKKITYKFPVKIIFDKAATPSYL
jgi:hypothetical protein